MAERRRRGRFGLFVLLILFGAIGWVVFRQGLIPARYSPLPRANLDNPLPLLIDWQLAELRNDRELCRAVLQGPNITATQAPEVPLKDGCGMPNGVRLSAAGGARVSADRLTCEAAAALAIWMAHEVQPLALTMLGQRVTSVQHLGTYSCRNIVGNPLLKNFRSEHATANAIDVSGFTLADGRTISVRQHWEGDGVLSDFLKAVHERSCRYFRVALSPAYNKAHHDHFHFDRGIFSRCL
jgi:hypothetical protein